MLVDLHTTKIKFFVDKNWCILCVESAYRQNTIRHRMVNKKIPRQAPFFQTWFATD